VEDELESAPGTDETAGEDAGTEIEQALTTAYRRQPTWTYFLTPAAIVMGAAMIAATIWWTRGSDSSPQAAVAIRADEPALVSTALPAGPAGDASPTTLLAAYLGYAKQIGIDTAKFQQCLGDNQRAQLINRHLQRGSALGINGTPTFIINDKLLVGAQPTAVFEEIINAELKGSPTTIDGYSATIREMAATTPPRFQILPQKADVSEAFIQGSPNAKVMIAEYSDFQCPFCKSWTDSALRTIKPRLGNDIALAFLQFPIVNIHPNAGNASLASICAGDQGKFWEMHDILFARQQEWGSLRTQ
jgi:protein-disulfide isomerase